MFLVGVLLVPPRYQLRRLCLPCIALHQFCVGLFPQKIKHGSPSSNISCGWGNIQILRWCSIIRCSMSEIIKEHDDDVGVLFGVIFVFVSCFERPFGRPSRCDRDLVWFLNTDTRDRGPHHGPTQ